MNDKRLQERYEKAMKSWNSINEKFPWIPQSHEGYAGRIEIRLEIESLGTTNVELAREVERLENRLDMTESVLNNIIAKVPEAATHYQYMLDMGSHYLSVIRLKKEKK